MAVRLRLERKGNKHRPFYHLVATDQRKKMNSDVLAQLGSYDPLNDGNLHLDGERIRTWLAQGAKPTQTVHKLLKRAGVYSPAPAEQQGAS